MDSDKINITPEGESASQLQQSDRNTAIRFVAFLDIMGFKDRVARTSHTQLLSDLTDFNRNITSYIGKYQNSGIELAQFSDSIVLFSNDTTQKSLKAIAEVTKGIMQTAIKQRIPIKGAIAQGKTTCDRPKQLFFGQSLIDAYLLEENIYYYGIIVHHTAEASVIKMNDDSLFKDIKAPLKSGNISHFELSWYINNPQDSNQLEDIISDLKTIRQTVSDAPRKYIDNTLNIIDDYYKSQAEQ